MTKKVGIVDKVSNDGGLVHEKR